MRVSIYGWGIVVMLGVCTWVAAKDSRMGDWTQKKSNICAVHKTLMTAEVFPVQYGLMPVNRAAEEYFKVRAKFRNAQPPNGVLHGGCVVREPKARVWVCAQCTQALRKWMEDHPFEGEG